MSTMKLAGGNNAGKSNSSLTKTQTRTTSSTPYTVKVRPPLQTTKSSNGPSTNKPVEKKQTGPVQVKAVAVGSGAHADSRTAKKVVTSPKQRTPWTVEAAGRVASVTARQGDGTVKKGSFAADAMSRAMKNEHNSRKKKG